MQPDATYGAGLVESIQAQPEDNSVRTGIVTSVFPLVVTLQGGSIENAGCLSSYTPNVGDTVALVQQNQTWLCMGRIKTPELARFGGLGHKLSGLVTLGTGTTASGVFVAIPGNPSINNFVKRLDGTDLVFRWSGTAQATGGDASIVWGVRDLVNGAQVRIMDAMANNGTNGSRKQFSGVGYIQFLAAGTYNWTGVWARAGGGTPQVFSDDRWCLEVEECWTN